MRWFPGSVLYCRGEGRVSMKKLGIFSLSGTLVIFAAIKLWSSIYGVPPGYTGSPVDGITCATMGCHRGPVSTVNGWITTDVPAIGYQPSDTYTVTLTATRAATTKFGFQMATQGASGTEGGFLVTDPVQTQLSQGPGYITHKEAGTTGNNIKIWQCKWIAPADSGITSVGLHAAVVAGIFDVDDEVIKTYLLLKQGPLGLEGPGVEAATGCFPNPFRDHLTICCKQEGITTLRVEAFGPDGQLYLSEEKAYNADGIFILYTHSCPPGTWFLRLSSETGTSCHKLIRLP